MARNFVIVSLGFLLCLSGRVPCGAGASLLGISLDPGDELTYRVVIRTFDAPERVEPEKIKDYDVMEGLLTIRAKEEKPDRRRKLAVDLTLLSGQSVHTDMSKLTGLPWSATSEVILRPDGDWEASDIVVDATEDEEYRKKTISSLGRGLIVCLPPLPEDGKVARLRRPARWMAPGGGGGLTIEMISEPRGNGVILLGASASPLDPPDNPSVRLTAELVNGRVIEGQFVLWSRKFGKGITMKMMVDVSLIDEKSADEGR
jgi:hypothetical protein